MSADDDLLPEERQAAAIRQLRTVAEERQAALAAADDAARRMRALAVQAVDVGVTRMRVADMCGVSTAALYLWIREAGLPVGPPRGRAGRPRKRAS